MSEIVLKEIEVLKLNLQPGDVLITKLKGEEFGDQSVLDSLRDQMKKVFPSNKVLILWSDENNSIDFSVVTQKEQGESNESNQG